ncbi:hypothetical protein CVT24_008107 [Panaeolus cyanescens]|uniref:Uncharacterized protein n=1 Tax=Panaeolus cyanescens TaxID=181874 RepID=A0A409YLM4_9AGAR|nr:hypothetical protein CVT24_008107 [Panaeolus cyanescens]
MPVDQNSWQTSLDAQLGTNDNSNNIQLNHLSHSSSIVGTNLTTNPVSFHLPPPHAAPITNLTIDNVGSHLSTAPTNTITPSTSASHLLLATPAPSATTTPTTADIKTPNATSIPINVVSTTSPSADTIPSNATNNSASHLSPSPNPNAPKNTLPVNLKSTFRSSIEPVDASGEWLPAVAILGESSSTGSGGNVGPSASVARGSAGVTRVEAGEGQTVNDGKPQASTSATVLASLRPSSSAAGPTTRQSKPLPPLLPSMARVRPYSLDLSDAYPADEDLEGQSSSDPLTGSFSGIGNPKYSTTANHPRYSLMSEPPETPLSSTELTNAPGPLPPRFLNLGMGEERDLDRGSSSGGVGVGQSSTSPSWVTGLTGHPAHATVQLRDTEVGAGATGSGNGTGTSSRPWHTYHTPRDTNAQAEGEDRDATTPTATRAPNIPSFQPQAPGQPWTYPAFHPSGYPIAREDAPGGQPSLNFPSTGNPWSAPAPHNYAPFIPLGPYPQPPRPAFSAPAALPAHGVRFAPDVFSNSHTTSPPGYEANDPFKRHTKPVPPADDLTFDDIPLPGRPGLSETWHRYEGSGTQVSVPMNVPMTHHSRPQQGQSAPPPTNSGNPTYSHSQPMMGSAPQQSQQPPNSTGEPQRPPTSATGSGSGPYLPLHSNNGSYQSYPYYPPPISPAVGTWKKRPFWHRVFFPFRKQRDDGDMQYDVLLPPVNPGSGHIPSSSPHPATSTTPVPVSQLPPSATLPTSTHDSMTTFIRFVFSTLPSQVYLLMLLRLPALYFSRVARIFEEADLTLPELKKMALEIGSEGSALASKSLGDRVFSVQMQMGLLDGSQGTQGGVPIAYERLKATWESFIDSVLREWKTFNIISVLLLSAILTILQIEEAAADPVTRYTALYSLVCALISLLFGCVYIIRFGTMRKAYKAAEWALEAKKSKTLIWWNVWILLAMPAIWLSWSLVLYVTCILSFVWRTGDPVSGPPSPLSPRGLLVVRIVLTLVLGLGAIYGSLIFSTFRRYGESMDRKWKLRIDGWIREKITNPYPDSQPYSQPPSQPHSQPFSQQNPPYPFPHFFPAPYDQGSKVPVTSGNAPYPQFRTSEPPVGFQQSATANNDLGSGGRDQPQRQTQEEPQLRRSSPIPTSRQNDNERTTGPSYRQPADILYRQPPHQPFLNEKAYGRSSVDDEEVPRYDFQGYTSSLSTHGYSKDAKTQFRYEDDQSIGKSAEGTSERFQIRPVPSSGDKANNQTHTDMVQVALPQNPPIAYPVIRTVDRTINSVSPSTSTDAQTQAPPYISATTSSNPLPTPPSYASISPYNMTHNIINNPIRFNPPQKKNPQISMPPPPSLPTIPGTPLTIVTMRSFDSTAGAENYPLRGSPGDESLSNSTSVSILHMDVNDSDSPGTTRPNLNATAGLSPRAASKRPAFEVEDIDSGPSAIATVSARRRSMSPQTPRLSGSFSVQSRPLSSDGVAVDRLSHGSARLAIERLPPGAAPPIRTSGIIAEDVYDPS